jgi:hypothetical protein
MRLRAERRCSNTIGLAVVAMAGETGSDAIRKILGRHGVSAGYHQNDSEQPAHPYAPPSRWRRGKAGRRGPPCLAIQCPATRAVP